MNDSVHKGVIGVAGAMFGIAISKATIIFWLQIFSLAGGIVVTGLTIWSIILSIERKLKARRAERSVEQKMKHKDSSLEEEPTTTV